MPRIRAHGPCRLRYLAGLECTPDVRALEQRKPEQLDVQWKQWVAREPEVPPVPPTAAGQDHTETRQEARHDPDRGHGAELS